MKTSPRPRQAEYANIPEWVRPARPDVASFFASLALADLEGGYIRLRAADQRSLLGCVPFGASALKSDGSSVRLVRSVCFGTDSEALVLSASELNAKIEAGESCVPGIYAKLKK